MSKYHIIQRYAYNEITESNGVVTEASPALDWSVDLPFDYVRQYCERKGWKIVPIMDNLLDVKTFTFKGSRYDLYHDGINIKQIMKDDKEIAWSELPSVLKGLL
jgi:hypothetical protein